MKIFISHSSKNSNYGQAIVDLLVAIGINSEEIIFTSNDAFGIPTGQNIFAWLKARISEKPHVVYLLSTEYYASVACLNEMGAAWIVENDHTVIFTPEFQTSSYEFQSGALDPRQMGFRINNHDRVVAFIESLRTTFSISKNSVLVNQKIREFIQKVENFKMPNVSLSVKEMLSNNKLDYHRELEIPTINTIDNNTETSNIDRGRKPISKENGIETLEGNSPEVNKFFSDLRKGKLKDEEILILYYIIDTARSKLGTGWKAAGEIDNIKTWEDVNTFNDKLSSGYEDVIRRFEIKRLTETSETTSHGNPREVMLIKDFSDVLFDLPNDIDLEIQKVVSQNEKVIISDSSDDDPFPF